MLGGACTITLAVVKALWSRSAYWLQRNRQKARACGVVALLAMQEKPRTAARLRHLQSDLERGTGGAQGCGDALPLSGRCVSLSGLRRASSRKAGRVVQAGNLVHHSYRERERVIMSRLCLGSARAGACPCPGSARAVAAGSRRRASRACSSSSCRQWPLTYADPKLPDESLGLQWQVYEWSGRPWA